MSEDSAEPVRETVDAVYRSESRQILATGGFYKRKSKHDQPSFGVETASIDKTLKAIEQAGGKITTPKHSIGEWGFMADFADPEGNVIALWEKAKQ